MISTATIICLKTSRRMGRGFASDGYLKYYYFDERVYQGPLPGDIWLRGKSIPAPAGWSD